MLTLFKTFDKFLNSFNFEFEMNPEQMFKDIKHEKTEEKGSDENSTWHQETWTSENGKYSYYKKVTKYQPKQETKGTYSFRTKTKIRRCFKGTKV